MDAFLLTITWFGPLYVLLLLSVAVTIIVIRFGNFTRAALFTTTLFVTTSAAQIRKDIAAAATGVSLFIWAVALSLAIGDLIMLPEDFPVEKNLIIGQYCRYIVEKITVPI